MLCELQGVDRAAAATQLGVPEGTLSSRLARAKDLLRRRLVKRGLLLSAAGVAYMLTQATARAAVPSRLAAAAIRFAAGSGAIPGSVGIPRPQGVDAYVLEKSPGGGCGRGRCARHWPGGIAWIGVPAAAAAAADDAADKDKKAIQGKWKIVSAKHGEKDLPDEERDKINETGMVFDGDKMTAPHNGSFKLDASKKPKEIDLTIDDGPENRRGMYKGVYVIDGDKLTLHLGPPGQDRPTKIEADKDAMTMILVLERVKK